MAKRLYRYPCDPKILEIARAIARQAARDDYAEYLKQWEEAEEIKKTEEAQKTERPG